MAQRETILVIGAGHCGGRAVDWLRRLGSDARIVLVGGEALRPYERPPLSKGVLTGAKLVDHCHLHPHDFYSDNDVTFLPSVEARGLDISGRSVDLSDGTRRDFDKLLLTTGGHCRRLPIPGEGLSGVHYLRNAEESEALARSLRPDASLVVIGGGFIGLEVAASARHLGCDVTVLEAADRLLGRVLPPEASKVVAQLQRNHGVELRLGMTPIRLLGANAVSAVELDTGEQIPADVVLVGIGIVPASRLAEEAGLPVDDGVLTDASCRTSAESIYAAGDVTRAFHPRYDRAIRLESWQNAERQAETAARALVGAPIDNATVPWVWSDQHGWTMQFAGDTTNFDRVVQRGALDDGAVVYFFLDSERLVGAFALGEGASIAKDLRIAQRLIERDARPDAALLGDTASNLKTLLKAS